jgi:hypothetical protein
MDLKVYTFYGEAPLVLLRRADRHGVGASVRFRVVDREGRDAVETYARKTVDKTLELPDAFDQARHVAERLSIPIRAPFMRIDLYAVRDRVIFGEATPRPGADISCRQSSTHRSGKRGSGLRRGSPPTWPTGHHRSRSSARPRSREARSRGVETSLPGCDVPAPPAGRPS